MRIQPRILLPGLLAAIGAGPLAAQTPTAAITGVVRDSTGASIGGAEVEAVDVSAGYRYRVLADRHGRYWLGRLPPGVYDITASRIGAGSSVRGDVVLGVGQNLTADFVLTDQPIELPALQVREDRPLVETTQAKVAFALDGEQIEQLPEETRDFLELAQLAPGATRAVDTGEPVGPTGIGALSPYYVGVLVDGVSAVGAENNEILGGFPLLAISEFEVLTAGYSAEFGRAASGIVNAVTRRGSNQLSVDGFLRYGHHSLNATGRFEAEKPDFERERWGVSVGGPIARDRTHALAALELRDESRFASVETGGLFPALEGTFGTPSDDARFFGRLDHRLAPGHDLTLRYAGQSRSHTSDIGNSDTCGILGTGSLGSAAYGAEVEGSMHSLLGVHRWSSTDGRRVNEARVSWQRRAEDRTPLQAGPSLAYPTLCDGGNAFFWDSRSSRVELRDDLSLSLDGNSGSHRIKTGILASIVDVDTRTGNLTNGVFNFATDTSSLPSQLQLALEGIGTVETSVQLGAYLQDQWSPSRHLTLDLGLRYDIETNSTNQDFVAPEAGTLPFIATSERPVDADNLAPRIGIAWDPTGESRTVVRGGAGIFYQQGALWFAGLETSRNRIAVVSEPGTSELDAIPIDPDATLVFPTFLGKKVSTPFLRQASLGVETVGPAGIVLSLDGVVSEGRNLPVFRQLNSVVGVEDGVPVFRFPGFLLFQLVHAGESESRMLILRARKKADAGWFDVSYTLARREITTDVWLDFTPQNDPTSEDFSGELGPADWDERHRLVALAGMRAPWGTGAFVRAVYSSSRPFDILTGNDDNGDFFFNDRPPGVGRNEGRGPDYFALDLSLSQRFPVGRGRLEVRFEVYNLTNRTNFLPESVVESRESAAFGRALAAVPRRRAEIGVAARF